PTAAGSGEFQSTGGVVQNTTNVGSDDFVFGDTSLSGAESKFWFDKSKAAFRAGEVSGSGWDDTNVGDNSIAIGSETLASGDYSGALGYFSNASGDYAMGLNGGQASGQGALALTFGVASGQNSLAWNGTASGDYGVSIGGIDAGGENSIALMGGTVSTTGTEGFSFGQSASTTGVNGISFGNSTTASGLNASALGYFSNASGDYAMGLNGGQASGQGALALTFGVASGQNSLAWNGTASGDYGVSIGGIDAGGENSMALMGGTVSTTGTEGLSFGQSASTTGVNGISFGNNTTASGLNASAFGFGSGASGDYAFAINGGQASGQTSTALTGGVASGDNTLAWEGDALGNLSVALGGNVIAYSYAETVIGYDSAIYTPSSTTAAVSSDRLFVVANNSTNNALTMLKDGKMGLSRIPTTNILEVEGDASKSTAGSWLGNSDRRLKTNIKTISEEKALDKILNLRGVTYQWNDDVTGYDRPDGIQYGFIAQELMQVFPEKVSIDNQGFYQTAYGDYDPVFVQAFKALHSKIEKLEQQNKALEIENAQLQLGLAKMNELEARMEALEILQN
ncbi:MAG: hypothetical protein HKN48_04865, partial [Flavobacteriaceae bacterium]|nr:hypothetical protein [Flavobacteriaceae bacterium]